ncbi:MAG: recombinase family protein [bacterium]|nr:recombinase family protein [bacterium]MCP4935201.1 recombinase family protein [bacterium]
MIVETHSKVKASHLNRDAYLYVRQSTMRQVFENTESAKRQYALRQRAVALGWPTERVHVIDSDLGQSGASAADREGFKRLITEVSLGHVGVVLGLEVSRLARNCADWHRLLELCALADSLILDEDGLYNPNDFNDRLLLGLKGTMSEAELHFLRARLQGGILNKAKRGELASPLPVGFVYDEQKKVRLDPDSQVRETITVFFQTYRRVGSAYATVKYFKDQKLLFPRRLRKSPNKGELLWGELCHSRTLSLLHNPRYGGAFVFGRMQSRKGIDGKTIYRKRPREEWISLIPGMHEGYISFEEFEDNQRRLKKCAQAYGLERSKSSPREGSALGQGIVICGVCGCRMTVRYHERRGILFPQYNCQKDGIEHGKKTCQRIPGVNVDRAISELLMDTMTPIALNVALAVQDELSERLDEANRLRAKQVERLRYEADLARQRYMQVDPNNRLVANILEAEWNQKLRALEQGQQESERQSQSDRFRISEEERTKILALTTDFPRLWKDLNTPDRDRKRMVRLLIEDITLTRNECILIQVRFKGGTTAVLKAAIPLPACKTWQTADAVVVRIDQLQDNHTFKQIASMLNNEGLLSGKGKSFTGILVGNICREYGLKSRWHRLREKGLLTVKEMAGILNVSTTTVKAWYRHGLLSGQVYNDKHQCLFEPPGADRPFKHQGRKLSKRHKHIEFVSDHTKEVYYEA